MPKVVRDPHQIPVELCVTTEAALESLRNLRHADAVAVDCENEVLRDENGKPLPIDPVTGPGPMRVISIAARFGHGDNAYYRAWVLDTKWVNVAALVPVFKGIRPWGWNAPYDRFLLRRDGLWIRKWWDGMLFDAVLKQGAYWATGGRPWYSTLEDAGEKWLGISEIEGKDDTRYSYNMADPLTDDQIRYAADDALVTLWNGEVLIEEAKKHDLYETCVRGANAQSFIDSMEKNGLALDRVTYQGRIDEAQAKMDAAAERIAVATTGKELLTTVVRWAAKNDGTAVPDTDDALIEHGLTILKDAEKFAAFIAALREQLAVCREQMAALTGAGNATEDLFSNQVRYELPFDPDNETTIRKFISKTAPVFTAEFIAAAGGTNKQLVKAHDLDEVYAALTQSAAADVTQELRQLAVVLASYRRYARIVADYGTLVGPVNLKPDWNVNSGDQVKAMLNTFCEPEVAAYTAKKDGYAHPLGKADKVDADALKLIDSELAKALLAYREQSKTVTTYGNEWIAAIHPIDGRVHGRYTQELTGTGRLSSMSPNMQNASIIKPFAFPPRDSRGRVTRVLVCADLSQAEKRFVADMSQDENMLGAFRNGDDLHERTAAGMNRIDMKLLKANGEKKLSELVGFVEGIDRFLTGDGYDASMKAAALYKLLRSKAKAVGFGYDYGLKGKSLANQLTVQGIETTKEEADEMLKQFDLAYPGVAEWMQIRVDFINNLSAQMKDQSVPSGCDFEASWRLHRLYRKAFPLSKQLREKLGRKPGMVEIAEHLVPDEELRAKLAAQGTEVTDEVIAETRASQAENIAWALGHYGSAVLAEDGTPWSFESRTSGNRRRLFQVGTKDWLMAMVLLVAQSRKKYAMSLRDKWVNAYNAQILAAHEADVAAGRVRANAKAKTIALTKTNPSNGRVQALSREEMEKVFEGQEGEELKISFISFVLNEYQTLGNPAAARDYLFRHAMADRIRAMSNRYRNHPIQGGVADAVLEAYAEIDDILSERFPNAWGVQSVHDSIVVECDLADAKEVRDIVVSIMEKCLARYCPTVPCIADGDIQLSLDDKTIVQDEQVDEMLSELAAAA